MKVGITATRVGLNPKQIRDLHNYLNEDQPEEFHHGGCRGGDTEASWIAHRKGIRVVCHPPTDEKDIGDYYADEVLPSKEYLDRNHDIVDVVDKMYAFPKEDKEQWRGSGTWATIRYAQKKHKRLLVSKPHF